MRASELVEKLQKLIEAHGDLRVQPILDEAECDELRDAYDVLCADAVDERFNLYVSLPNVTEGKSTCKRCGAIFNNCYAPGGDCEGMEDLDSGGDLPAGFYRNEDLCSDCVAKGN